MLKDRFLKEQDTDKGSRVECVIEGERKGNIEKTHLAAMHAEQKNTPRVTASAMVWFTPLGLRSTNAAPSLALFPMIVGFYTANHPFVNISLL